MTLPRPVFAALYRAPTQKKLVNREVCEKLLSLIKMGKARVVKEHTDGGPEYYVFSQSGDRIGTVGAKYKYLFEAVFTSQGSGDGLFEGHSQTVKADK